jgi:hypothetical protein
MRARFASALLAAAVLLAVAAFSVGCGTKTVVVRKTTVVHDASQPRDVTSEPSDQPSRSVSPPTLGAYRGSLYSAEVPTNWTQQENDVAKSGYVESQWRDLLHSTSVVRIDAVAGETAGPAQKAGQVRALTSQTAGYSEIAFGSTALDGQDAWRWVFQVSGTQRVDYFRNDCGTGIAVLGTAAPADFPSLESTFQRIAASVSTDCATAPAAPTTSAPSQDFCATHACIDNFDNGTGYIVQCNDGMWSHSGGRPGACSYHGGESGRTYP